MFQAVMNGIRNTALGLAVLLGLALAPATRAQDAQFAGRWVIASATIAPWAVPGRLEDRTEERRLVGRTVAIEPHAMVGPAPLGCAKPVYKAHDDPPDMLFEGALAEPDAAGKPRDPVALARRIGMTTPKVRTLEIAGCAEIAFHRLAPDTLVFGINDRIYYLHRAAPPKP